MSGQGIAQIVFYSVVLVALGYPLGVFMARVYAGREERLDPVETRLLPAPRPWERRGAGLEVVREDGARLQRRLHRRCSTRSSGCRATSSSTPTI